MSKSLESKCIELMELLIPNLEIPSGLKYWGLLKTKLWKCIETSHNFGEFINKILKNNPDAYLKPIVEFIDNNNDNLDELFYYFQSNLTILLGRLQFKKSSDRNNKKKELLNEQKDLFEI